MKKNHIDNKGMTLIETTLCFALLGMLLVAASQVIATCTNVYYDTKSTSSGTQTAQAVAMELEGELADAKPLTLAGEYSSYCVYSDGKSIQFIGRDGNQVVYAIGASGSEQLLLKKTLKDAYNETYEKSTVYPDGTKIPDNKYENTEFTSQYIGLDYSVKEIRFTKFVKKIPSTEIIGTLPIEDCPILKMEVKMDSLKYGEYTCTEYVPLYNFYGYTEEQLNSMIHIP